MLLDPSDAVFEAILALLRANVGLRAVTGSIPAIAGTAAQPTKAKVFDSIHSSVEKPYVGMGKPQMVPAVRAQCLDAADVNIPLHGWSAGPSSKKSRQLGNAIVAAIDEADLQVTGFRVLYCEVEGVLYLDDPDPLTQHVVVDVRVQTEPA